MSAAPRALQKKLLALAIALAASFALAETGVRLFYGAPIAERLPIMMMRANPTRGYEMVPSLDHYTYQNHVHINALGLRGAEVEPKKPGELRVLFLGDSLVYGQGMADDESMPARLEQTLRARDPTHAWSVVNAGVRAYDTHQELALLEELGSRIQPDFVLLGWYWNDLNERATDETYKNLKDKGELAFDTGNRVEGWDRVAWEAKQLVRGSALIMLLHDVFSSKGKPFALEYVDKGFQRLGRHLEHFRAQCERLGATPVFVLVPDCHQLEGPGQTREFAERAAALVRERGMTLIELLPAIEPLYARERRLPILPFDGHYAAEANRAFGEFLAERVLALDLPPHGQ
jgi:hypothetical protein